MHAIVRPADVAAMLEIAGIKQAQPQVQISSSHTSTKPAPHTAPMSCTTFVDLLQQVPDLMKSLTPRTTVALLCTTRALRRHIQQATTSIKFLPNHDAQPDLQLLVGNQYPQLRHLDLSNAVEVIDLFDSQNQQSLSLAQWPLLTHLTFCDPYCSDYTEPSRSLDMVNAAWPLLEQLDLGANQLHSGQWVQLAQGSWPSLKVLGLSACKADAAAIAELVRGDWPYLAKLDLSCNSLDAHCIAMLTAADWLRLKEIQLQSSNLDDFAILELVRGHWLCLEVLNIGGNKALTTDALGHLSKADWPLLRDLELWSLFVPCKFHRHTPGSGKFPLLRKFGQVFCHLTCCTEQAHPAEVVTPEEGRPPDVSAGT